MNEGKLNETIDGFKLKFIAHSPQKGFEVIICQANRTYLLLEVLKMWRENFNIISISNRLLQIKNYHYHKVRKAFS